MTTADEILTSALERIREIYPPSRSVGFHLEPARAPAHRCRSVVYTDRCSGSDEPDALGGGCVIGYGATAAAAFDDLCGAVRTLIAKKQAKPQCVVCREQGVDRVGDVSTGEGLMCREHALEWLQSEQAVSEENVGPCGAQS